MPNATYQVEIDWDNSGLFDSASGAYEDITAYVRARPGVTWDHGNDVLRAQQPPAAGAFSARLHNASHLFSIDNAAGGLYGDLKPRRRLRLQASYGGTTYPQWRGLSDELRELVDRQQQAVDLVGIGNLAWLTASRGRGARAYTALYSDIRTDQALGYLLDAVGWPMTLPNYILDAANDYLGGYWRLGEASGDAIDSNPTGVDGTVTIGAGTRDYAALDDQGDGCIDFDGANTKVEMADALLFRNVWTSVQGGGSLFFIINPDTAGEGSRGTIAMKQNAGETVGWNLRVGDGVLGAIRLHFEVAFTVTSGLWKMDTALVAGTTYVGVLTYSASDVANNPTLYLWDATNGYQVLTVGSGLTELSTPEGAYVSDVGEDLVIGNNAAQTRSFNGRIDEIAIFWKVVGADYARGLIARALWCPRILDTGLTTLAWWWLGSGDDAFLNMQQVLNAEGPGACIYEDRSGRFVFESRRYRSLTSRCTTSQATFRDTGAEPLHSAPCVPSQGYDSVVNSAQLTYKTRSAKALGEVWALGETVSFAANETRYFVATMEDPVTAVAVPASADGDFTVVAGSISTVVMVAGALSGTNVPFYMTAGASGATISGLRLRAQSVTVDNTSKVINSNDASDSQAEYGVRGYSQTIWPELDLLVTAQALADAYVAWFQQPVRSLAVTVNNGHADRLTQILSRAISDRITVIEAGTTLDAEFFIEHLTHQLPQGRFEHLTRMDCTRAEDWFGEMFTLDSAGSGILDTNRLGF